ncbi:MAG: SDR family oxidoreductase, partial [Acetobacteraceae bacterium]|nr:SDR family oxidoreductase [Acetobacteraceae bacterium]
LFAREGAQVIVADRDWQAARECAQAITGEGGSALAVKTDVSSQSSVVALVTRAVDRFGGLDVLVNCAGISIAGSVVDTEPERWERVLDVNLTGAMRVCRAAVRHWGAAGGAIVLVSSGAGLRPMAERSAYCASKAGLNMLAKVLAIELAPLGIRVNAVCPGAVETELFRSSLPARGEEEARAAVRARYALGRIAEPAEIAACVLFLLGDGASFVTGTALAADGGRTFH